MMIGRSVQEYFPQHVENKLGRTMLKVSHLSSPGKFKDISFEVRAGEILGFAGLVGAGRSEIAKAIFGLDQDAEGQVELDGGAAPAGVHPHCDESRHRSGARGPQAPGAGADDELPAEHLDGDAGSAAEGRFLLDHRKERDLAEDYIRKLRVKTPSIETPVAGLSGGNQQKVALAKWLARAGKLLIVDEPTRGVDIGAKAAIHELVDGLAQSGLAVILISSELPEVINLSTRILVMRDGHLVGELPREQATQEGVLRLMAGVA